MKLRIKAPIALRPEFRLLRLCHPDIDPDDLWRALVEHTVQSAKGRKGPRAERFEDVCEDAFLAVIANASPEKWVYDDEVWQFIIERCRESTVGDFWKCLTAKRRRQPLFGKVELFLLKNWRVYKGGPGLRDFSDILPVQATAPAALAFAVFFYCNRFIWLGKSAQIFRRCFSSLAVHAPARRCCARR